MAFKDLISNLKAVLKEKLDDKNLELFTQIDKDLDALTSEHEKTEKELSTTKDKLIEVVKNTSFKKEEGDEPKDKDMPMDIDEALTESINEELKKKKGA